MFGFFDAFTKRIDQQIAEYTTAQAHILERSLGGWQGLMSTAQPVSIESSSERERRLRRLAMQKAASRR